MIIDGIVGGFLGIVAAFLSILPASSGTPTALVPEGFGDVVAVAMYFDVGVPVTETLALMTASLGVTLVIDGFIAFRAMARWLPSWLTGGG